MINPTYCGLFIRRSNNTLKSNYNLPSQLLQVGSESIRIEPNTSTTTTSSSN